MGLSSYEVDVFGRVKNLQDEALQAYLALTETRRSTQISLVAEVGTAWLTLAADNERLKLAQETLASQQSTYRLTQRSHGLGGSSGLAVSEAQTTVESARVDVAQYASQILQDQNALTLLVGSEIPDTCCRVKAWSQRRCWCRYPPSCRPPCCSAVRTYSPPNTPCSRPISISARRGRRFSQHYPDCRCRFGQHQPVEPVQGRRRCLELYPEYQPADLRRRQ